MSSRYSSVISFLPSQAYKEVSYSTSRASNIFIYTRFSSFSIFSHKIETALLEFESNIKDDRDDWGSAKNPLKVAVALDNIPMVRLFLEYDADLLVRCDKSDPSGYSSIHAAVGRDDADPEQQAAIKYRPLYYYARRGNIEAMRVILRTGAKVDPTPDIPSYTPLHAAAEHNLDAVKLPKTKNFVPDPRI
jgi:hypothetical protein